jgi:hypothetical protein
VRIPRGLRPGIRALKLRGFEAPSPDDALLELLLGDDFEGEPTHGPARLNDLIDSIEAIGRWDGVRLKVGRRGARAFKDDALVISGRTQTRVRVLRRH